MNNLEAIQVDCAKMNLQHQHRIEEAVYKKNLELDTFDEKLLRKHQFALKKRAEFDSVEISKDSSLVVIIKNTIVPFPGSTNLSQSQKRHFKCKNWNNKPLAMQTKLAGGFYYEWNFHSSH